VGEVRDGLADLLGSAAYVNYIDPGVRDWAGAYYGANLDRLREVARRYDPDRVLAFDQGLR
jgi:FAD/FMN-containing dehydrogenase